MRVLLLDVDGVLTDGAVLLHGDGSESKRFHIRDGTAVVLARRAGLRVGLISARPSDATMQRAAQLDIDIVHQAAASKVSAYEAVLRDLDVTDQAVAYMGDDLIDLPLIRRAGFAAAPADASDEVRAAAHWISSRAGGGGAVRELVEFLLKAQERWATVVEDYLSAQH